MEEMSTMKKLLALLLSVAMILSLGLTPVLAAEPETAAQKPVQFADLTDDHWAKGSIDRWSGYGIVNGDENGNVNADMPLRRCEMAQVLVNLLGLTQEAENTFGDLTGKEWYAGTILKCAAAGIMKGDGVNCNAEAPVTRQEAIVMFGRAMGVRPAAEPDLTKFDDHADVADWAAPYMAPLTEMGILSGVEDGSNVAPKAEMNRASTFALLDKAIAIYADQPGEYKAANANGFVVVNSAAEEAGEVVVSGEAAGIVVSTGTTDDVVVKDMTADTVKVDAPVDMTVEGKGTVLGNVQLNDAATVDVAKGVQVDTLEANAPATVTNNGTVDNLIANDAVKVDNQGTVKNADVNADDVVLDGKAPQKMDVAEGVAAPTDSKGNEVEAKPSTGSSSASGPSTPSVTKYTVTVAKVTGGTVTADPTSAAAGTTINVTAKADEGYELGDVTYTVGSDTAVIKMTDGKGSFTMPKGNVTVSATFTEVEVPPTPADDVYAITVDVDTTMGTLTTAPADKATAGETVKVTVNANTGYKLDTLTYTAEGGEAVDIKESKSFTMPAANVTVKATFTKMTSNSWSIHEFCIQMPVKLEVDFGTSKEEVIARLPDQVPVWLVDMTLGQYTLDVSWESTDYNSNKAGEYSFEGTLGVVEPVSNPSNMTAKAVVTVKAAPAVAVTGVSLDKTTADIYTVDGDTTPNTVTLKETIAPANATNKNVTWSSSNKNVATVNNGVVTAVAEGTATITVTTVDGGFTATCTVTVHDNNTVTPTPVDKTKLEAAITAANAAMKDVTVADNAADVAKDTNYVTTAQKTALETAIASAQAVVDNNDATQEQVDAAVTALEAATTTFNTAKDSQVGTKEDTVAVTGVTLDADTAKIYTIEDDTQRPHTVKLTATVSPDDATDKTVTWSSSDEKVATVSNDGTVTAVAAGEAVITTTAGEKSASCTVTVVDPTKVTVATVAELTAALANEEVKEITVSASFDNGTGDAKEDYEVYNVEHAVAIKGEAGATVKGSFVVKSSADGTSFEDLTIQNFGCASATARRNAISANVATLTVKNCTLKCGASTELGNGLMIMPSAEAVNYTITGNTFEGFQNTTVTGKGDAAITWASTGLMITGGLSKDYLGMTADGADITNFDDVAVINGNTFNDCKTDYVRDSYTSKTQVIFVRCNSTVGTSLNFDKAAKTANYYIKGAVTRESDTTLKAGTTLTILDGGSLTIAEGATLTVEKGATIVGEVSGKGTVNDLNKSETPSA